jgi:quercetin dioxygenase-like cupin family protein
MNCRSVSCCSMLAVSLVLTAAGPAPAQEPAGQMTALNVTDMKLVSFPGMPTCATGAVVNGDPSKGPSIILSKLAAGCTFPWHWHTPNEHLMIVSGAGHMEMKDGKPVTLQAGAFALMPSHHVHRFTCPAACTLYVYSDVAFDMHYVDAAGKEIAPDEALKAVKETAAQPPK